uniref:Secreted protein n=1 Tax=Arundo donax TaxID=35708 RepID=A0A0A9F7C9_ARUDO
MLLLVDHKCILLLLVLPMRLQQWYLEPLLLFLPAHRQQHYSPLIQLNLVLSTSWSTNKLNNFTNNCSNSSSSSSVSSGPPRWMRLSRQLTSRTIACHLQG